MCDCFHLAFPNWHAASSGTGAGRRLRGPEPGTEDDSICDEPTQFTEGERPRPQGSSPVEEYPETEKYSDSDKECEAEHDPHHKSGSGKKTKKSGLGSMFEKRSTPKMSKLKEVHSPESGVIVKTAKDGCAEGLIYGGGGKEGIFIKEVVPESPASKNLKLKEGDQVLSATVYFDNVSYEDAIQILEHAQAYKVKLCLKRKPDMTESEPAIESDVIPEEDLYAPDMREQGKTKRRGDARISWPKFPSFGKGKKSRFTRSHSSSEADEQRKLELSPTTSDTESPIKSQDALKGKKRHKMKLSVLTKRGRISSSEDQDTDAPTTGQMSTDIYQTASDMLSPECLESLSGEAPEVYVTEDLKAAEDLRHEQNDQKLTEPQTIHKVELISIDSTLKTADVTVALADKESPSGIKSPDEKKKKKERSELKMKILGKDKSLKKDAKAKASPKRLKTLGASIEIADQPENEKSDVIPGFESHTEQQGGQLPTQKKISVPEVELDISDATFICKSPQKGEEKTKKGKDKTFKLPKVGLSDIATEETIQKINVNVEEKTKIEQLKSVGTEVKEDPYDRLSKSSLSRTQLPKREDIEIPGMEDMSKRATAKGIKEPKVAITGHHEDIQAETVQMSIDVDSVKEAVSKLPGFKLPKVDTSGVPIPEEITVIDANAQRISVKTPTKVVDGKTKHETHFTKFDISSPEISKTTVKLPKITAADLTSEDLITETKIDFKKSEKEHKTKPKQSDTEMKTEVYKREDIIIPGKESAQEVAILQALETEKTQGTEGITFAATFSQKESDKKSKKTMAMPSFGIAKPDIRMPDIGIDLPKQNISEQKGGTIKGERTVLLQEVKTTTETRKGISDVKIPEIDSIEYIDSVGGSPAKKDGGIRLTGVSVNLDVSKPQADISFPGIRGEVKDVGAEEHTITLAKSGGVSPDISVNVPHTDKDINIDGAEIKMLEKQGKGSKFKMPNLDISMPKVKGPKIDLSLSKKDVDVTPPEVKADVKLPEAPETDITLGKVDVSVPVQKIEVEKPELEIKPLQIEGELDGQGSKLKMPKFGVKMPKIKGPEFDLSLSRKDVDVTLPEAKAEVKLPQAPDVDVALGKEDVSVPEQKIAVEKPELGIKPLETEGELDGQGSKFKRPKFGIKMPGIKGPEFDLSLSKKDVAVTLPEAKAGVKLPDAPDLDGTLGDVDVSIPEQKIEVEKPELEMKPLHTDVELDGQGSKFKIPKLGIKMPKLKGLNLMYWSKKDIDVTLPEAKAVVKLPDAPEADVTLVRIDASVPEQKVEVEKSDLDIKTLQTEIEVDGQGSKFKMPKFGIKMPKLKGPEFDLSLSKKDADITLPEAKVEVKLPEAPEVDVTVGSVNVSIPEKKVEIEKPDLIIKTQQTEVELEGQGSKFKMPKLGITMPKVKGPESDFNLSKKDVDVTLPEAKVDIKLPDVGLKHPSAEMEIKPPGIKGAEKDAEGSPSKFKMPTFKLPKFGATPTVSAEVSSKTKDIQIPETQLKSPEGIAVDIVAPSIDIEGPSLDMETTAAELDGKGSKFKMPKFGISLPKVRGPEIDLSLQKKDTDVTLPEAKAGVKLPDAPEVDLGKVDVSIPEGKMEVKKPELEIKPLQAEAELDGQGSKFEMPKFAIKMPKIKGPEFDLGLSRKDTDVTLPEAKAEVKLPDVPEVGVALGKVDVSVPEQKIEVKKPELEIKPLQTEVEVDGQGSKFKMPKFGIKMPKLKGPEFDLSLSKKDIDVTLPEAKAEVKLPDVPEVGVALGKVDIPIPEQKIEVKKPEVEFKPLQTEVEVDGQGSKFKMPKFGIKMPKLKGPEFDLSLSKKDIDVTLPEAKGEVKLPEAPEVDVTLGSVSVSIPEKKMGLEKPEVEFKPPQTESDLDGQGRKFEMPKFGISMPKVKGPEIDFSLSKKDVDVTLPEAKGEVKLPDIEVKPPSAKVEIKAPEIKGTEKEAEGSSSKFKMPTFKLPKFGAATPNVSVEVSSKAKDIQIPETQLKSPEIVDTADITAPNIDIEDPSLDVKMTAAELDGKGGKFKMPKFGISMPKVKGPEIDLSLSKKDVDVTLPEAEADVKLPDVEYTEPGIKVEVKAPEIAVHQQDVEGSPSKFKMPAFKLPKFGIGTPKVSVEVPDMDKDVSLGKADVSIPEEKLEVKKPELDTKPLQSEVELDGQGSKFKMPKLGMSMPHVKGPEIHFGLSKKEGDIDVTLPEAKAEVEVPKVELKEPAAEVEVIAPDIKVAAKGTEGSPSKFKMPTFKLPKFGVRTPSVSVEVPNKDKDVKIDGADIEIPEEESAISIAAPSIDIEGPSIDLKTTGTEQDGKGGKFKMPYLGFSMPKAKGPKVDLSLSKKDVDITLPEATAEVQLPEVDLGEVDVSIPEAKMEVPKAKAEVKLPEAPKIAVEMKPPECEAEIDGHDGKFKIPKFGIKMPKVKGPEFDLSLSKKDVDVTLPEVKAEVKLPDAPKVDVNLGKVDVSIPEAKMEVGKPELEIKPLQTEVELEGQGSKFKMPKFGMSMPKVKGPEFHLGTSKKDVDVTLPEAQADINLPDVELKEPSAKAEIKAPKIEVAAKDAEGSPSKFKMPSLNFSKPKVKGPDIDLSLSKKETDITLPDTKAEVKLPEVSLGKAEVMIPEAKVEVKKPEVQIKPLQTDIELDGQGSKFKMPKFGISMPKVKGPEIDLSLSKKDVDVTLPETKADLKLPDVELKDPSAKVEVKAPEIEAQLGKVDGSPSKFKLPTFKLPKFGAATPKVIAEVPDVDKDIKLDGAGLKIPQDNITVDTATQNIDVEGPSLDVKMTGPEGEGKGGKFKMPKFGISLPKVQGPEIDLSLSKKDADFKLPEAKAEVKVPEAPEIDVDLGKVDVSIPEAKMEVKPPELEVKPMESEGEIDGQGSKFKMPKFGISMPKVKGPEIDFSLSKKDADVTLPEAKAEVNLPDVEIKEPSTKVEVKAPEVEAQLTSVKGSPSKFKLPTFKFPKFGGATPNVSAEVPDADKEIKIDGAHVHVSVPHADVDLPEVKAEVHLPEVEVKEPSGSVEVDAKLKKPRFSLPRFSFSKPSVKAPEVDVSLQDANITIPGGNVEVKGEVDMKLPEHEIEVDGQGSKFKMPKSGITMPNITGPEFDLSLSKKDVDINLPKAKAEVRLPEAPEVDVTLGGVDVSIPEQKVGLEKPEVEIKPLPTEVELEGQGSKFKMPKFGMSMPKVKGPEFHLGTSKKDVDVTLPEAQADINLPDVELKEPSAKAEIKAPKIEVAAKDAEGSPSKFKMPSLSFSKPKVKGPDIDLSLSKKETDIMLPDTKAEVKLPEVSLGKAEVMIPEAKVEVKKPEVQTKPLQTNVELDGQGSKFKMPKFGIKMPKVKGPEFDLSLSKKDVDVTLPEAKAEGKLPEAPEIDASLGNVDVSIPSHKMELKKPELETKPLQTEGALDGQGSKFKMPKLGITMSKVKGPEIDFSLSKKDVDVTIPEAKAEIKLPDVEVKEPSAEVEIKPPEIKVVTKDTDGSPSKFKMPTFKLPKFGVGTQSVSSEVPDMDKNIKIDGADINIPEEVLAVSISAPNIDTEGPSIDMQTIRTEHEGKGSKFKLPNLGFSVHQVKGRDIDLSVSKKDVDVTIPEAKADVQLPDVELKEPSAKAEIKGPEIEVQTSNVEGSPSKFKMPTLKLPKFGAPSAQVSVEVPDVDKDIKVDGADLKLPEVKAEVKPPDVEGVEGDQKVRKTSWTLPRFSFSKSSVKGPEAELNLDTPKVDVTLPEVKTEMHPPDINIKESLSISVEGTPATDLDAKLKKPRFSLPRFSFSKQSTKELEADVSLPQVDVSLPEGNVEVKPPEVELEPPKGDVELDGHESKFKMPKFGISMPKVKGPDIDLSLTKKDVDVTLPEAKAEVQPPDVKIKQPSAKVEIKGPEIEAQSGHVEGSPSKFKMPSFTLPKFGASTPKDSVEVPDVNKDIKIDSAKLKEGATVDITAPNIDTEGLSVDVKAKGSEVEGTGSKFKMPKFGISMPKVKGPEIDLSLSKKDVDVTLPEAKAEVQPPDVKIKSPTAKVEIKGPEIEAQTGHVEGSPSKFKMPSFTLPKFGASTPKVSVEVPDVDKDIKIDGAKLNISKKGATVDVKAPNIDTEGLSVDVKTKGSETDGSGSKFKMPKFGISMPKGPEIDLSLSKKDVDVTLPGAKAEVQPPDVKIKPPTAKVEIKGPEIEAQTGHVEGSPSKFKMPSFTLPKFGASTPKDSVEVPDVNKDIKIDGAKLNISKEGATVDVKAPSIDTEGLSVDVKTKGSETDGSGSKFKMPKFGISMPKVKGPEIDLSLSKKDVDVTLPESKAEVQPPDVKIKSPTAKVDIKGPEIEVQTGHVEGSPSKFKMPSFTLPKFGASTPKDSVEVPDVNKDIKIDSAKLKEGATVDVTAPSIDTEGLSVDVKTKGSEIDGSGSKFKMPKFGISMPKVKGPETDLSLSKKDVDVTFPEAKAEVQPPDVKIKSPTAKVEIKGPEIEAQTGHVEGSPSKFKMPSFTLPKFGAVYSKGQCGST
ncbi:LOW QUALITY PROTEIN: neuroblast differentiation-associated protein AHNAK [Lates calcarifer]|uniref:LOW QUALITY PROTEIN: neuroblast differentiation-associated protein AHNAK n=1 Tax=Lates calcarifer TaxID=8187 RepID=A0AAJ8BKD0_LATCA|nr:LOW QUALITY PROTEIN: neuroblast differentiation-associated protein AHNAK [Lates calcarifer]